MYTRLSKLREKRAAGENGFTLIELLVVVVILGILIAIAIPLYLNYRKGANDASAKSDLRGAISALEQCNADNSNYPTAAVAALTVSGTAIGGGCTQQISLSSGTTLAYYPQTAAPANSNYIMTTTNSNGATKIYCYASAAGGQVKTTSAAITAYAAACPA